MPEMQLEAPPRRKQLADQLDRFDAILDGLAEGLTGAVADATREGTHRAVKDALLAALRDPEIHRLLAPRTKPSVRARVIGVPRRLVALRVWYRRGRERWATGLANLVCAGRASRAELERAAGDSLVSRQAVLIALAVGLAVGVGCLFAPPELAALVAGAVPPSSRSVLTCGSEWCATPCGTYLAARIRRRSPKSALSGGQYSLGPVQG